jgi:hypothetical protein
MTSPTVATIDALQMLWLEWEPKRLIKQMVALSTEVAKVEVDEAVEEGAGPKRRRRRPNTQN